MSRGGSGGHTRVLTARKRTAQSTRWLERRAWDGHLHGPECNYRFAIAKLHHARDPAVHRRD